MNSDPSNAEIYRLVQEHYLAAKENIGAVQKQLEMLQMTTGSALIEATKTNGRVTKLEGELFGTGNNPGIKKELGDIKTSFIFAKGSIWVIIGIITIVPTIIVSFATLYIRESVNETIDKLNLEKKITDSVTAEIQQTFRKYNIEVQ